MICVSLREPDYRSFIKALIGLEMAEIRLDGARLSSSEIVSLFAAPLPLVATYRSGRASLEERREMLSLAIRSGARYVDLEIESPPEYREALIGIARTSNCRVIVSYHNEQMTPTRRALDDIADRCEASGADVIKIACRVRSTADCARLLSLYERPRPVIAIGMGALGTFTRIVAPFLGAPFTFAALTLERTTADGQLDARTMAEKIRILGDGS